jgi:hypothetical protein
VAECGGELGGGPVVGEGVDEVAAEVVEGVLLDRVDEDADDVGVDVVAGVEDVEGFVVEVVACVVVGLVVDETGTVVVVDVVVTHVVLVSVVVVVVGQL